VVRWSDRPLKTAVMRSLCRLVTILLVQALLVLPGAAAAPPLLSASQPAVHRGGIFVVKEGRQMRVYLAISGPDPAERAFEYDGAEFSTFSVQFTGTDDLPEAVELTPPYEEATLFTSDAAPFYAGVASLGSTPRTFPAGHVLTVTWPESTDLARVFIDYTDRERTNIELAEDMDSIHWEEEHPAFVLLSGLVGNTAAVAAVAADQDRLANVQLRFRNGLANAGSVPDEFFVAGTGQKVRGFNTIAGMMVGFGSFDAEYNATMPTNAQSEL
jgi:hypothetical protein